eukprot:TRINITY_DN14828_c0_g1_i1.p1 TRINITY_DN14828_c0_g1~~TRINITY_DN14828_c0_g1_i1.p1  ORF type:complete len:280 (-),score=106.67 TRINITY_DN14828_c0_g1_i1:85-924(-)
MSTTDEKDLSEGVKRVSVQDSAAAGTEKGSWASESFHTEKDDVIVDAKKKRKHNIPFPESLAKECEEASNILHSFTNDQKPEHRISPSLLKAAKGLVFLNTFKVGVILGVSYGAGVMVTRQSSKRWSAPAVVATGGMGLGVQLGVSVDNIVMVLLSDYAVEEFSKKNEVRMDFGFSIAFGIYGEREDVGDIDVVIYTHNKGLFGGYSIDGALVHHRQGANKKFYGKDIEVTDIVGGKVEPPAEAQCLYDAIAAAQNKSTHAFVDEAKAKHSVKEETATE